MDALGRAALWESLKAFVLDRAPRVARALEDAREASWEKTAVSDAQAVAVSLALGRDPWSAPERRRARRAARALAAGDGAEGEHGLDGLDDAARRRLEQTVAWIAEEPPAKFLSQVSGPQAAARETWRKAPALKGLRGLRWLAAIGYPCAAPGSGAQRFLQRMGWLGEATPSPSGRLDALAVLEGLARDAEAPLAEVGLVLEAFTGDGGPDARGAALCLAAPLCGECPVRDACALGRAAGAAARRPSRNLVGMIRTCDRPRERLIAHGAGELRDHELLAVLLRTGSQEENALDLAQRLLRDGGGLRRLAAMGVADLAKMHGLGPAKAATVLAALELARRTAAEPQDGGGPAATSARIVFERLRGRFLGARREEFVALLLDAKLKVMREATVSIGTVNQSLVHPREAFREAIRESAYAVIFAHNHPSGDPAPSRQDEVVTGKLAKAGELVGIRVLDHVIIGRESYYSFADEGKLDV